MLSKRSDILLQLVLGFVLLGFMYLGLERLWFSKARLQISVQQYAQALKQCQEVKLKSTNK